MKYQLKDLTQIKLKCIYVVRKDSITRTKGFKILFQESCYIPNKQWLFYEKNEDKDIKEDYVLRTVGIMDSKIALTKSEAIKIQKEMKNKSITYYEDQFKEATEKLKKLGYLC